MKCCIMLSSKYSLNCCTCLIWFDFETWFEFELKTLEKINRKGIRNSLKLEKPNLAHLAQVGPACESARAPARDDRRSPPVSLSRPRVLSLFPSRCLVGQACRRRSSRTRARFSLCPADPTCQLVPNLSPTFPRRGRAHDRVISGHLHTSSPLFNPALRSPTFPHSLAPSAEPSRPLSRSARATRELRHRPPSTDVRSATVVEHTPRLSPR